jgi:thiosulfate dehydrogenase (quinone) large subunit
MTMPGTNGSSKTQQNVCAGASLVTLLAVQIIIGWEWLASGITKVASGTFVSGLAGDLHEKSRDAAGWYRSFLDSSIIPNAHTFGVLIEVGEIAVGLTFILGGILWLTRWSKLSDRLRVSLLGAIMAAALGATFMAINFHLASGGNHPWLIPKDGFDETIDVDSVLAMIQVSFVVFCGYLIAKIHRQHQAAAPPAKTPQHGALPAAS